MNFLWDNSSVVNILRSGTSEARTIMALVSYLCLTATSHSFSVTASSASGKTGLEIISRLRRSSYPVKSVFSWTRPEYALCHNLKRPDKMSIIQGFDRITPILSRRCLLTSRYFEPWKNNPLLTPGHVFNFSTSAGSPLMQTSSRLQSHVRS